MKTIPLNRRKFLKKGLAATAALGLAHMVPRFAFAQVPDKKEGSLFEQINRARDPEHLEGLERGHVPIIHCPASVQSGVPFEVEVRVGEKLHEMIPAHFIDWIDLYAGEIFLTKLILTPNFTQPVCKTVLTLNRSATLRAIEHCNLHGLWEGTRPIEVV